MENKIKSRVIIFSKSQTAIRAEPALSLYGDLLSYYPQIKFLGITFDNRMTFTKHFEQKVGSKSLNHFENLQTMCKTNIRIRDCFYHNCFRNSHHQNTKSQELFH